LTRAVATLAVAASLFWSCSATPSCNKPSKTLSGVPYERGAGQGLARIEFVTVTVDCLDKAGKFYGDVMGYKEVSLCPYLWDKSCTEEGYVRYSGADHQAAIFQFDDPRTVPDLTKSLADGGHEIHTRFYVHGNSVVQLLKFASAGGKVFDLREARTSPCWMAKAHLDFWIKDGIDANAYIADVEARSADLGLSDVAFNRPVPQESRADRQKVPMDKYANKVQGGAFDGLPGPTSRAPAPSSWRYTRWRERSSRGWAGRIATVVLFQAPLPSPQPRRSLASRHLWRSRSMACSSMGSGPRICTRRWGSTRRCLGAT